METHVYNYELKRYEPLGTRCVCCGKGYSRGDMDNYYVFLYKGKNWRNMVVVKSVEYNCIKVGVSRCANCKKIQRRGSLLVYILTLGLIFGSVALGWSLYYFLDMWTLGVFLGVVGIVVSIVIGWAKGPDVESAYLEKKGVLSKELAAQEYEDVAKLVVDQGWTFERPSPDE